MKKIFAFIICLFIFPIVSNAATCTSSHSSEIKLLATNVNIIYEITMKDNTPIHTITLSNLTSDMVVIPSTGNVSYNKSKYKNGELTITLKQAGQYEFSIYSFACKEKIAVKTVNLPSYNAYYKDELCKGLEKYAQCQRWSGYKANRKTFESDIKKIKEDEAKLNQKEEEIVVPKDKWYEVLFDWFLDFWWLIVILLIGILGLYYYIINRRKKNEYDFKV